jgi:hypothetical protein
MNRFGVSKESFLNFATSKDADKGLVLISIPRCIRHLDRDRIIFNFNFTATTFSSS